MSQLQRRAQQVRDAWSVAGPVPGHHRREQERLMAHWPALARAIQQLAEEVETIWPRQGPAPRPNDHTIAKVKESP